MVYENKKVYNDMGITTLTWFTKVYHCKPNVLKNNVFFKIQKISVFSLRGRVSVRGYKIQLFLWGVPINHIYKYMCVCKRMGYMSHFEMFFWQHFLLIKNNESRITWKVDGFWLSRNSILGRWTLDEITEKIWGSAAAPTTVQWDHFQEGERIELSVTHAT